MTKMPRLRYAITFATAWMAFACVESVFSQSYYKDTPLFSKAPDINLTVQTVARFGPVGMPVELHQPAFTVVVGKIEDGLPAAATGKFKAGHLPVADCVVRYKDLVTKIAVPRGEVRVFTGNAAK